MLGLVRQAAARAVIIPRTASALAAHRHASAAQDPVKQLFIEKIAEYREHHEEDPVARVAQVLEERLGTSEHTQ